MAMYRQASSGATPSPPPPTRQRRGARFIEFLLIFIITFAVLTLIYLLPLAHNSIQNHMSAIDLPSRDHSPSSLPRSIDTTGLTSGLGLVTTDGLWDIPSDYNTTEYDIKIIAFTDKAYLPIAKVWYHRLTKLGYKEHYLFTHDQEVYDDLKSENCRVLLCPMESESSRREAYFNQVMAARVRFARELVRNGTHVLLTDVDAIFSRYVNPLGFVKEGYDVYHAHEMRFPTQLYEMFGLMVNGGHHFFTSTAATIRFLDIIVDVCGKKCDDQVVFNKVFWKLDLKWDGGKLPTHPDAMRISNETDGINGGLLVESSTGRSKITGHSFKIWDRDFATRLSGGIPESCPSKNNWVGMPSNNGGQTDKIQGKLALFDVWDEYCFYPDVKEKSIQIACSGTAADCSMCKSPVCKSCWISENGRDGNETLCTILDANIAADEFFEEDGELIEMKDGTKRRFCQNYKYGSKKFSCGKRVEFMVSRYHVSQQDAKVNLLEELESGCSCAVNNDTENREMDLPSQENEVKNREIDLPSQKNDTENREIDLPSQDNSPSSWIRNIFNTGLTSGLGLVTSDGLDAASSPSVQVEIKDDVSAFDRRMLKYFQSYYYVPPVPEVYTDMLPAKECGASPNFDEFFALSSRERSAKGEDKFVYENLFKGKADTRIGDVPGTFVEIGAYNGMHESNSRFFEACLGWKGLLIEGQPGIYRGVLRDRPHAHKMSFAPSCDAEYERVNKTIPYARYPKRNAGLKGYAKTYDSKPHIDVPCGPFSPVLEDIFAMSNGHINFFSLDVEGSENLVLQTMDFTKVKIDVMMIEIQGEHCRVGCVSRKQVREKMASEGYIRYENLVPKSDLYVHPNSTYQLADRFKAASS